MAAYSRQLEQEPCLTTMALLLATLVVVLLPAITPPCAAQSSSSQDWVDLHNEARAEVGVGALSWNKTVAAFAESYAELRQADCELTLSNSSYGENLFWGSAGTAWNATDAVGLWVSQKKNYDHDTDTCKKGKRCGAYTQIVWADTVAIGCARVVCDSRAGVFMICSYDPPGNVDGESPY